MPFTANSRRQLSGKHRQATRWSNADLLGKWEQTVGDRVHDELEPMLFSGEVLFIFHQGLFLLDGERDLELPAR